MWAGLYILGATWEHWVVVWSILRLIQICAGYPHHLCCMPIFRTFQAVHEALDEPSPNTLPWIDRSSDSYTPPQTVVCELRSVFLILCQMTFSLFREIHKVVPLERLPDVKGCLGLNHIFLALPFHPSGNLVHPVMFMVSTQPGRFCARPHVQTLVENSDCCNWLRYSLIYLSVYTCLVCGVVGSDLPSQLLLSSQRW